MYSLQVAGAGRQGARGQMLVKSRLAPGAKALLEGVSAGRGI